MCLLISYNMVQRLEVFKDIYLSYPKNNYLFKVNNKKVIPRQEHLPLLTLLRYSFFISQNNLILQVNSYVNDYFSVAALLIFKKSGDRKKLKDK